MVCSLVSVRRVTGRALAGALRGPGRAPFAGAGGMLMGTHDGRVDLGIPVQLTSTIGLSAQRSLDPGPGPVLLPTRKPLVDRLPRPVPLGQVPPGDAAADPEQDAIEDLAVVTP